MSTIRVNRFENTSSVGYGCVVQVVNTQTGAMSTTTSAIPLDDSIPQNTEGLEVLTASITPKSATNKLKITVNTFCALSTAGTAAIALFQDSTANALAATAVTIGSISHYDMLTMVHYMTTGTTSSTTFKVRIGTDAGTLTFNGQGGARRFGGVAASSITIEEIQV